MKREKKEKDVFVFFEKLRSYYYMTWGLLTKEQITFRKPFWNVIQTLSWFESLILLFVNAKLF